MEVNMYLDLEGEVHSIWVIWTNNFQECKGNLIFLKSDIVDMQHGRHPDSEGGMPGDEA